MVPARVTMAFVLVTMVPALVTMASALVTMVPALVTFVTVAPPVARLAHTVAGDVITDHVGTTLTHPLTVLAKRARRAG